MQHFPVLHLRSPVSWQQVCWPTPAQLPPAGSQQIFAGQFWEVHSKNLVQAQVSSRPVGGQLRAEAGAEAVISRSRAPKAINVEVFIVVSLGAALACPGTGCGVTCATAAITVDLAGMALQSATLFQSWRARACSEEHTEVIDDLRVLGAATAEM